VKTNFASFLKSEMERTDGRSPDYGDAYFAGIHLFTEIFHTRLVVWISQRIKFAIKAYDVPSVR